MTYFIAPLILGFIGVFLMWKILFRSGTAPKKSGKLPAYPRLSVIIPARNEALNLERLLKSLQTQTVQPWEVIVVDDVSTDTTGDIARSLGATVVDGEPLPEGWYGKSWACWQGVKASRGELLLFLDADTWLEPEGIERLLALFQGNGLLSVQPYHITEKFYEQFSSFFNIVIIASLGTFTPLGERVSPGGAFGPCILCSKADYTLTGGHRQVRNQVLEDITLAKVFLRNHLPVHCHTGQGIISFRMYPAGWRQMIEGWSKGMGFGATSVNPFFSILSAAWIFGCFDAFSTFIRLVVMQGYLAWGGLLLYIAYAGLIGWMLKRTGRFQWWTWVFFPIPLIFFTIIIVRSLFLTFFRGKVVWKGRAISTRNPKV